MHIPAVPNHFSCFRRISFIGLLILAGISLMVLPSCGENLLPNGSFAQGTAGWKWDESSIQAEETTAPPGVLITTLKPRTSSSFYSDFAVPPAAKALAIKIRYKTDDCLIIPAGQDGQKPPCAAFLKITFLTENNSLGPDFHFPLWPADDWNNHNFTLAVPAGFHRARCFIFPNWVIDLKLSIAQLSIEPTTGGYLSPDWGMDISRPLAVYQQVLSDRKIERNVNSWNYDFLFRGVAQKFCGREYSDEMWRQEMDNYMRERAAAGINGPFLRLALDELGLEKIQQLYREYGMVFLYFISQQGQPWQPDYEYNLPTEQFLREYGRCDWIWAVVGKDEPFNTTADIGKFPELTEKVTGAFKERFGMSLPETLKDEHEAALARIAFWRMLNENLRKNARWEFDLVHKYAPGMKYEVYNRNATSGMDFIDQSLLRDFTDWSSADPYPAATLSWMGRERAIYHVGFTMKLITDLGAGLPSKAILAGFRYHGMLPTPANLREWVSQAAKAGAIHLDWFTGVKTYPRFLCPPMYREMLRLSRLWKDMPALAIPDQSRIAVIFSDDARAAVDDRCLNSHYTLHAILGEQLGAWFTFVGENQVKLKQQSLDGVKLIIVPQLSFTSQSFAQLLADKVRGGATLVVLDPHALEYDFAAGSLGEIRAALLGGAWTSEKPAHQLLAAPPARARFGEVDTLALRPFHNRLITAAVQPPADARVLFTYDDGSPAAYSRRVGAGEVIVFAALPFGDAGLAAEPSGWTEFFRAMLDELKIERELPIWRFMLPPTGGEVETFAPLLKMP